MKRHDASNVVVMLAGLLAKTNQEADEEIAAAQAKSTDTDLVIAQLRLSNEQLQARCGRYEKLATLVHKVLGPNGSAKREKPIDGGRSVVMPEDVEAILNALKECP